MASSCMDNTVKNLSKDGVSGLGWLCVLWCVCRNMAVCVCPCMYAYVGKFVCLRSMCLHNVCVCVPFREVIFGILAAVLR